MSKGRIALFLLCIVLLVVPMVAQDSKPAESAPAATTAQPAAAAKPADAPAAKPADPEGMSILYQLLPDQPLKALPQERGKVVTHKKGFSGATGHIQIPGTASTYRLKAGQELVFVVKTTNPEGFKLYPFEVRGKNREALISAAKAGFFGGVSSQNVGQNVTLDISKYGEMSYKLKVKDLKPGEYGFINDWAVFHFAVE